MSIDSIWAMVIAFLATASCALVGCYLVLRRLSLLGDAISHAVLPGLVLGFMASGSRTLWPMLIGAAIAGLLTTYLTELLRKRARLEASAGMGVVFTSLFAIGVILMQLFAHNVDLDPGCVLYGSLGNSVMSRTTLLGFEVPPSLLPLSCVLLVNLAVIIGLWKEFKISSFDPALATTVGISAGFMHYLLMSMVACTTVAAFESVGSILVIAMLIVPGATAHLLSDRLGVMMALALVVGLIASVGGVYFAEQANVQEAAMMALVSGALLGLAVVLSPRYGVLARTLRHLRFGFRIVEEDILARLYRVEEGRPPSDIPGRPRTDRIAHLAHWTLRFRGLVERDGTGLQLTSKGRRRARSLIRSHRAWESFLAERLALPLDHLHEPAHRMEHYIGREFADEVLERLRKPERDPHGREIPD